MKLVILFLSSIVAAACSSNPPRAWQPAPAESARVAALEVRAPAEPARVAPLAATTPATFAAQEHVHDEHRGARIALLLGIRSFDEDDYEPVEDQPVLGIDFSYEPPGSFVGFEVGLMGSAEDDEVLGLDLETRVGEIYAGVRKTFSDPSSGFHPYLGGGVSAINVDVELEGAGSDDDTSLAGYVHAGLLAQLGHTFFVGIDGRALFLSDIEIAGASGDADYLQAAIVLGWAF